MNKRKTIFSVILAAIYFCFMSLNIDSSHAALKSNLTLTIVSGEIRYQSPAKVSTKELMSICQDDNYKYPYGEKVIAVNEKGALIGQGKVSKWLPAKLVKQEAIDPEVEYEMELEGIKNSLEIGLLSQEEYDKQFKSYMADKFAATILCSTQATFSVFQSGNYIRVRISGFNVMDFLEFSKLKKTNWKLTVRPDDYN